MLLVESRATNFSAAVRCEARVRFFLARRSDNRRFEALNRRRRIVDHESLAVARSCKRVGGRIRRRIARDDAQIVGAVGQGSGVPRIKLFRELVLQNFPLFFIFAAIQNDVAQIVLVIVVSRPQTQTAIPFAGSPAAAARISASSRSIRSRRSDSRREDSSASPASAVRLA